MQRKYDKLCTFLAHIHSIFEVSSIPKEECLSIFFYFIHVHFSMGFRAPEY